jgi:hypothetical protein
MEVMMEILAAIVVFVILHPVISFLLFLVGTFFLISLLESISASLPAGKSDPLRVRWFKEQEKNR